MPGIYTYAIGAWRWDADYFGGLGCYVAPAGAVSLLDYRNDEQMGQPNRTDGYGLFAFPGAAPEDLVPIGYGYAPEVIVTPTARQEVRTRLGLSGAPAGNTLAEMMLSIFCDFGDPSGVSFAKPIDATTEGHLEIWLEGHSCVHRESFDVRSLLAVSLTGKANRIRDLWRRNLDAADEAGKLPEALGAMLMRCGYSRDEVKGGAKGRKAEWQRLVSDKVRAKHGAALSAKEPRTQLIELWPTAGAITSGQSLPWAANGGSPLGTGDFTSTGGSIYCSGTSSFTNAARCTTPVSSANHWATAAATATANYATGLAVRMNATNTFYWADCYYNNSRRLYKLIVGVPTALSTQAHSGSFVAVNCRAEANGSTISGAWSGYPTQTATDPAITGALLGGIVITPSGAPLLCSLGPVTIDDGLNPPVAAFSATPLSGLAPLSVAFTDASTNTPTSWLWERSSDGGGSWSTFSTSQNPTATFTAGTWAVRLTATNAGGSDGETKLAYITVSAAASGYAQRLLMGLG